jgi:hypothetical protein
MSVAAARITADWMQALNVLFLTGTLLLCVAAARRWPTSRLFVVGLMSYLLHCLVFNIFTLLDLLGPPWGNLWSSLVRLHATLYLFGCVSVFFVVALRRGELPGFLENADDQP